MKKLSVVMMSLMLISMTGLSQPGQRNMSPEDMAKQQTARIKEAVGLNAKQEKQVYDLNLESSKKMQAMRSEMQGGGYEGMREKMTEVREEQDKKMKGILTGAQWKKYEKHQEDQRAQRGRGRPGGRR